MSYVDVIILRIIFAMIVIKRIIVLKIDVFHNTRSKFCTHTHTERYKIMFKRCERDDVLNVKKIWNRESAAA